MTLKNFLKSKTFKCIIVLLVIALISGGLLAILNDVLEVSSEERVQRTITKIYGKTIGYEEVEGVEFSNENGSIVKVYKLEDNNILVQALGKFGYKNGSITIWAVAKYKENKFDCLSNIQVASYVNQTLMSKFTDKELKKYDINGINDVSNYVISGATYSSNAMNNAVNCIMQYVSSLETKKEA